jgi:hypothetical protein
LESSSESIPPLHQPSVSRSSSISDFQFPKSTPPSSLQNSGADIINESATSSFPTAVYNASSSNIASNSSVTAFPPQSSTPFPPPPTTATLPSHRRFLGNRDTNNVGNNNTNDSDDFTESQTEYLSEDDDPLTLEG